MAIKSNTDSVVYTVEHALAALIEGVQQVTGLFSGEDTLSVFCSTDEDFGEKLKASLNGSLGQCIFVRYGGRNSLEFGPHGLVVENGHVQIDVSSSLLLAGDKPESAISLAEAVDAAVSGTALSEPFTHKPCLVNTHSYAYDEYNGRYTAAITVNVQFVLGRRDV